MFISVMFWDAVLPGKVINCFGEAALFKETRTAGVENS